MQYVSDVKFLVLIYPHSIGVTVEYTSPNYSEVFMLWNDTDTGVRGMVFGLSIFIAPSLFSNVYLALS
jgi:hypothetical protein